MLDRVRMERATSLAAAVAGATSLADRIDAFATWAEENIGDVGWTTLEVEFASSTRHVHGVGTTLAQRRREITGLVAALIEDQARELGLTLPLPAEELAVQLLSLGIGLGAQRAFDPELPVSSLVSLLRSAVAGDRQQR